MRSHIVTLAVMIVALFCSLSTAVPTFITKHQHMSTIHESTRTPMTLKSTEHKNLVEKLKNNGHGEGEKEVKLNPLMKAAILNQGEDVVHDLVGKGVNVNEVDSEGNSALMLAVSRGNFKSVIALLKEPLNINIVNQNKQTATTLARDVGDPRIIQTLKDWPFYLEHIHSTYHH